MDDKEVKISNRKDVLLLLLYVQGKTKEICEPICGRTRLMKMMYLFEKEVYRNNNFDRNIPQDKMPTFEAYKYGPFSIDVFRDISFFINIGYIEARRHEDKEVSMADIEEFSKYLDEFIMEGDDTEEEFASYEVQEFTLTEEGKKFASVLFDCLTEKQKVALINFKSRYNSSPLTTLLRYVYQTYPESAERSEIRSKML